MKPTIDFLARNYPNRQWILPNGGDVANILWLDGEAPADLADKLAAYDPDAPQPKTVFWPRDYLKKFTMQEYAAARTHTNLAVQWALDNLIGARFVDIQDPDTIAGLELMVSEGVITSERKTELLTPQAA